MNDVTTTSEESKVSSYFKDDSFPDVEIMKGKEDLRYYYI